MGHFLFTLEVVGIDTSRSDYEDGLYESGCRDALVALVGGKLLLDFDRECASYDQAVSTAIEDVIKAGGQVVAVAPLDDIG